MKKALIGLAAAVLLLALVMAGKNLGDRARNRARFVFDTAQVANVTELRVAYGGEGVALAKVNGRWISLRDSFPVDSARVRRVVNAVMKIQSKEKVSESGDPARLAEFGLSPAEAKTLEWTLASGEKTRFLLGKTSGTDFNSTYWKWADKPEVYRTPGNFTTDIPSREEDWTLPSAPLADSAVPVDSVAAPVP